MEKKILYTVIIPTFNRSRLLLDTLNSVCDQTIDKKSYEIIVINDGSTDDTGSVISNFVKNHPEHNLKYLYQKNSGCAKARNNGILNASGEIIFFTDDDCAVPNNWMEKILDAFERYPEAVGVGGWYEPTDEVFERNKYYQFDRFFIRQGFPKMQDCEMYSNTRRSPAGNTANMAYKKCVLMEVGLFDGNIYFTGFVDWELKTRITLGMEYPLVYIPFNVIHKKKVSFKNFFLKSFNQGRGRDYCQMKFPSLSKNSYYNQSLLKVIRDVKIWIFDSKKRQFSFIYMIYIFSGLLGKYVNRLQKFKFFGKIVDEGLSEKKFLHIIPPNKKIIKMEIH